MIKPEIVFTDNMVLQRGKKIRIFGDADNGKCITVSLKKKNKEVSGSALVHDGKFEVILPELVATSLGDEYKMFITDGDEEICFDNVAVGEVFLAGGQSNMELELQNAEGGQDILNTPLKEKDVRKNLRYFYTPKVAYRGQEGSKEEIEYENKMRQAGWNLYSKESSSAWSAVGYYFALKLTKVLGVTVGIIGCNWGGTLASCWISRDYLLKRESTKSFVFNYENSDEYKKPEEEQLKEYEDYVKAQSEWDEKAAKIYAVEPDISWDDIQDKIGKCLYPGPMNCANFTKPAGLFETMVKRIAPYTLAGVIYYQGESDENNPEAYYDLQTLLIEQFRDSFKDEELPFIMTQLPMHRYQHDQDTKSWCIIREAQMKTFKEIKNSGIAVIIDCGKFNEIHPPKKKKVGKRLALQALHLVYNKVNKEQAFGPIYKDYLLEDNSIRIYFDNAEDGFVNLNKNDMGFEIASDDGIFKEAKCKIMKDGSIVLYNKKVNNPVMARYLWSNYREVYLYGANGLPVAPFRTYR